MSMVDVASEAARGLGGVALARGNLPNARHHYEKALQSARLIGASILEARAHRGLLIVTAKERDYEAAIQHAWEAFELSSDDTEGQGELLANLGGLLRECGHFGASFLSYSLAIKWTDSTRIRIPSLGGAALSAALDHKPIYVGILANLIESEVRRGVPPFEAAQVLLDLASAYEAIDAKKAIEISREAEALSHQHGYFELEYLSTALIERLTSARPEVARAPIGFSNSSKRVIDSVAALAHRHSSVIALVGTKE